MCLLTNYDRRKNPAFLLRNHIAVYDHIGEKHLPAELQSNEKKQFKRNNTKYKCNNCSLFVESYFDLLEHMKDNHAKELVIRKTRKQRVAKNNNGLQRMHKCPHCNFTANFNSSLKVHIGIHINAMFSCNICDVKKKQRSQVVMHVKKEHGMKLKLKYKGWCRRYVSGYCTDCDFLGSSRDYDEHLQETH